MKIEKKYVLYSKTKNKLGILTVIPYLELGYIYDGKKTVFVDCTPENLEQFNIIGEL